MDDRAGEIQCHTVRPAREGAAGAWRKEERGPRGSPTLRAGLESPRSFAIIVGRGISGKAERTMNWGSRWLANSKCFGVRSTCDSTPALPFLSGLSWVPHFPSAGGAWALLTGLTGAHTRAWHFLAGCPWCLLRPGAPAPEPTLAGEPAAGPACPARSQPAGAGRPQRQSLPL